MPVNDCPSSSWISREMRILSSSRRDCRRRDRLRNRSRDFVILSSARFPSSSIFFMSLFAVNSSAVRSSTRFSSSLLAFARASST